MIPIETFLLCVAVLIFVSVVSSKLSDRFAIPALLLFLGIGMLAGAEGIGGIYFDNAQLAKSIGVVALIFIIFSGGFDTNWKETQSIAWPGVLLATVGVLGTALITGYFAHILLKFSFLEGMLLGSIISSTDAAAVFMILRSRRLGLKKPLKPLLEFESGSNDPMAVFLTVGCISLLTVKDMQIYALIPSFMMDMGMGALIGYAMAGFIVFLMKRLKLEYEGLYPVFMISLVILTYSAAVFAKGNGFLAVYLAGLLIGQVDFPNKNMIARFHGVVAWLMQIVMFVTLGLLVSPSHIVPLMGTGLLLTFLIMVVARPVSVLLCLLPFGMTLRKKVMVAWVGLRGSLPIILATFPFMAGIPQANTIFNVVFFVVFASVLIQGTSIPFVAKMLNVHAPHEAKKRHPIEFEHSEAIDASLTDIIVPYDSVVDGKTIAEIHVPQKALVVLISRKDKYIVPNGSTVIEGGDVLLVLANEDDLKALALVLSNPKNQEPA